MKCAVLLCCTFVLCAPIIDEVKSISNDQGLRDNVSDSKPKTQAVKPAHVILPETEPRKNMRTATTKCSTSTAYDENNEQSNLDTSSTALSSDNMDATVSLITASTSKTESATQASQEVKASKASHKATTPESDTYDPVSSFTKDTTPVFKHLTVSDIEQLASNLTNMSKDPTLTENKIVEAVQLLEEVLRTDADTLIEAQKNHTICTAYLQCLEKLLTKPDSHYVPYNTSQFWVTAYDISKMANIAFKANNFTGITVITDPTNTTPADHFEVFVSLNISALPSNPEISQMAFVYHPTVRLVDAALAQGFSTISVYNPNKTNHRLNETIISNCTAAGGLVQVAVPSGPVHNLSSPMDLYFKLTSSLNSSASFTIYCVYWDPNFTVSNGIGGWSTEGCQYRGINNNLIHCQCDHFSAFTALFAYNDNEPRNTVDDKVLDWVTKIGCSLSIIGMASVIFTYIFIPQCRKTRRGFYGHHLIFHLSVALTTLLVTFLAGFEQTEDPARCLGVAMLLHFFTLVVFFWMLVESYYYYTLFVRVKTIKNKNFLRNAGIFAWGIPFMIVLSTVSFDTELYFYEDTTKYCWLRRRGFLYALLPFVFAILLVNTSVYVLIMRKVGCRMRQPANSVNIGKQPTLSGYSVVVMFFILGLSWIFGLLAIGVMRSVFSYLFCIFNSLQGFVIFPLFLYHAKAGRK